MKDNDQISQIASKPARQKKIIELIQKHGYVRVLDLSKSLNVAEITVRRDLDLLESEHLLERTHGGAIFTKSLHKETDFNSRSDLEHENKDLIAKEAAKLISDGDT
ncbi:MAG: DeoR/GlpR transcriptional regulator, partial [Bacteroidetes bacterium]|nr:DeoR/GlpR transcriptional regulator [Bacteroidota bacterium]